MADKKLAHAKTNSQPNPEVCPAPDLTIMQAIKQFEERFNLGLTGKHFVTATASSTTPGQMLPFTYSFYYDPSGNLYEMDRTATGYNFEEKRLSKDTQRYQITVHGQVVAAWNYSESPNLDMSGFYKTPNQPIESCQEASLAVLETLRDICSLNNATAQVHTFLY